MDSINAKYPVNFLSINCEKQILAFAGQLHVKPQLQMAPYFGKQTVRQFCRSPL